MVNPADLLSRRVRLRHLVVATTVAHQGSIRAASTVLHLTQPAISRSVAELEQILAVKLFDRGAKGMTVSADGAALMAHMHAIVSESGSLLRHADEIMTDGRGEVRVGTLLAGTADTLPTAVFEFSQQHPRAKVAISEATPDHQYENLMSGKVDFVLGRAAPLAFKPGVDFERLYDDDVRIVCTPGHTRSNHHGDLSDLVDDAWILPPYGTSLRRQVDEEFIRASGSSPQHVIECVAAMPLRALVLRGEHLAVVPSGIFVDELEQRKLIALPLEIEGTSEPVGIMRRNGAEPTATVAALVEMVRTVSVARRKAD